MKGLFYKGKYQTTVPYDIDQKTFNADSCSYKYVEEILKTSKTSCLI
jgi:hypothetical protein